jgi:hypothetical protein
MTEHHCFSCYYTLLKFAGGVENPNYICFICDYCLHLTFGPACDACFGLGRRRAA